MIHSLFLTNEIEYKAMRVSDAQTHGGLLVLIALAVALCAAVFCAPARAGAVEIPFVFEHNKVFIDNIYVGGAGPFRATLDTGTSDVILDTSIVEKLGLAAAGQGSARATGGVVKIGKYKCPEIKAGSAVILPEGMMLSAASVSAQADAIEEPTQLVLGYQFFRRNVVEMDYDAKKLYLHAPVSYTPPKGAAVLDLNLAMNLPIAKIVIEGQEASVMLDTGSNSALDTYPGFMERTGLPAGHTLYGMPVYGMGGSVLTNLLRLKTVSIAGREFKGVKVYAHTQSLYGGLDGLVGNEILRRYRVVYDYARGKAYLTPSAAMDEPWEEERAGLVALRSGDDYMIMSVVNNSPSSEAGLKIGDIITKINSKPAAATGISGLRGLVRGEPGSKLSLTVMRDNKELEVVIALGDYVK